MKAYYTPIPALTGALHQQPPADRTLSGWYLDARCNYNEAGFLDAPDVIPSGGQRGMVCVDIVVGIAHVSRDAA